MSPFDLSLLRPGDCLLYRPHGIIGWVIAIKTWHLVAHVEVYEGDGFSLASRDGIGCNRYRLRTAELCRVLRPTGRIDMASGVAWFEKVARGQKYDFAALARFLWPGGTDTDRDRQICSSFAARFYRAAGYPLFAATEDADRIAPFQFAVTPLLDDVWSDGQAI